MALLSATLAAQPALVFLRRPTMPDQNGSHPTAVWGRRDANNSVDQLTPTAALPAAPPRPHGTLPGGNAARRRRRHHPFLAAYNAYAGRAWRDGSGPAVN